MKARPNLDALMLFHEVLSAGSMTRASESLRLSTSTISRQIARLESEFGTKLLKRNTRKLVPTDIGRDVYERCETIAQQLLALEDSTENSRSSLNGTLRVSMPSEFGSAWLGSAIARFSQQYPDLILEIDVHTHDVDLIESSYDIVIQFGDLKPSRLTSRRIATLTRSLYASPGYLERHGTPDTLVALAEHGFIFTDVQERERTLQVRGEGGRRLISPPRRASVNSMRLAREMIVGGAGIGLLPDVMAEKFVASRALVPLLAQSRWPTVQATALILAREGIPRKVRAFLDYVTGQLDTGAARPAA
jgi:DNA-binding transcriptional LysR family regulator